MFSVKRITSIEYYEAQARTAAADEAKAPHSAGRDAVAYYTDNGQGESLGVWWTRTGTEDRTNPQSSSLPPSSIFGQDGGTVNGRHLRDLAAGRHPETGEPLTKGAANGKRSVGFDVTISAPKSVSVLAAFADAETRGRIFDAHDRAMRRVMDHAYDGGLVVAHRATRDPLTGKKSYFEEPVQASSAAVYRHFTSRAQDPQLHSHAVLMNVAVRQDGTTGAIDNRRLKLYGGALAAMYRAELASILRDELGVEVVTKGRNFEIAGVPETVIDAFSKRKAQVEAAMDGRETAGNRAAAQIAAYETRDAKDKATPLTELEERWERELSALGWSRNALWQSATSTAREIRRGAAGKDREAEIGKAARAAIERMVRNNSVIDDRLLMRDTIEALQTLCSADEALAAIEQMRTAGDLIRIGEKDGRPVYSTREIVEAERAMLRIARDRKDEREFASLGAIERAIAARPTMRADQAEAVRHALNRDGVSVVEGFAGSGKSFSLGTVAEIARDVGLQPYVLAPSHKAKEVVRADTKTAEEYAKAVQGFVAKLGRDPAKGGIVLTRDHVVIVDEAGMVGTEDMARLVEATAAAGCKLILTGDTRQLQPVVAGAPMKAIARVCGSSQMTEVTRQREAWQRAASQDFARGNAVPALEAYDRAGGVVVGDDRDDTLAKLVSDYADSRRVPDEMHRGDGKTVTRAILASWNVDVREINQRVREAGKRFGWIEDPDWTMTVIPRGSDEARKLEFAVGEDIIFGETVENVKGHTLYNADIARIARISGDPKDPTLQLVLAKGPTIDAKLSELVGRREEGEAAIPRFQHAAAMTVHASQGVTVDECYVANLRGMGQESTYVAMTRHRDRVKLYADGGRIVDEIAAQAGSAIRQTAGGATTLPEEEDDREDAEITAHEIKTRLFNEATKADLKENASDYMELAEFLDGNPVTVAETPPPVVETVAEIRAALEPTTAGNIVPLPTPPKGLFAAPSLFKRMQERAAAEVRYPVPEAPKPSQRNDTRPPAEPRISEGERAEMARTNLITFALEKMGAQQTEADQRASRQHYAKVRFGDESVSITQREGKWLWTKTNDRSVSGLIWDMVAWRNGGTKIEAMRWLRHELRTFVERPLNLIRPMVSKEQAQDRNDLANARVNWQRYPAQPSAYLTSARGIRPETLALLKADVKSDFTGDRATNRNGAVFAHRTPDGELVSYCRRGAPLKDEVKTFRSFAKGVSPVLFIGGEKVEPQRIYVTESSIDTISLYQHDRTPEGAMLVAPDGTPGRRSLDAIEELARRHPNAVWHVGLDNDTAGKDFDSQVRVAIRNGNEKATIESRSPGADFKDWNAEIRGLTREQEAAEKEKRRQQIEAEARRAADREERRRREAEDARNVIRGPRI